MTYFRHDSSTEILDADEYYRLADMGFFDDQRVELVHGEIVRLRPQKRPHALTIGRIFNLKDMVLEAYSGPQSGGYKSRTFYRPEETVTLPLTDQSLELARIFPT